MSDRVEFQDAAQTDALPYVLTVGDRTYRLYDLSIHSLGLLQQWVYVRFRDPLEVVTEYMARHDGRPPIPIEVAKFLMRDAREAACRPKPPLGTTDAMAQLLTMEGVREVLFLSISQGDPTFTRDDLEGLAKRLSFDQIATVIDRTGIVDIRPKAAQDAEPEAADPKAEIPVPSGA